MSHFDQKPARKERKKPSVKTYKAKNEKTSLFPRFKSYRKRKKISNSAPVSRDFQENRKSPGFSFPLPSLSTLAITAGLVVIALAAFNWEDINFKIPEIYVFDSAVDDTQRHIADYASKGIVELLPGIIPAAEDVSVEGEVSGRNDLITFEWQHYRVQRGDSVSVIAQKYGVSVGAIIASNNITNARTLQEGAVIRIPNIDGIPYLIKSGDSLSRIAVSHNVPLEVILDVNDIKSDNIAPGETIFLPGARMNDIDLRMSLGELFMWPVQNRYITSNYGMRRDPISGVMAFHTGIDIRADTGTPVVASLDGVVSVVSEDWLYGKYIIISHDNGYKTLYAHLSVITVKQGDRIVRGRKIGESGNTGYSTGPHLHFSIYDKENKLVNPLELIS